MTTTRKAELAHEWHEAGGNAFKAELLSFFQSKSDSRPAADWKLLLGKDFIEEKDSWTVATKATAGFPYVTEPCDYEFFAKRIVPKLGFCLRMPHCNVNNRGF